MSLTRIRRPVILFAFTALTLAGCRSGVSQDRPVDRFHIHPSRTAGVETSNALRARRADRAPVRDLIVGSWNIKWFGSTPPADRDFVTMADVIEEWDVVAVQELRGAHAQACVDALLDELNSRGRVYEAVVSSPTGYEDNADPKKNDYLERFAFLWDTSRVRIKGRPRLLAVPALNHPVFRQVPYVADFEVVRGNGFDFRVLTVHTVFNKELNAVRAAEIQAVRSWMLEDMSDGEVNLIAIGDFNANPSGQPHHFARIIPDESAFRVLMYESLRAGETPIRTTIQQTDAPSSPKYFQSPVYDHALISFETSDALPANPMTRAAGHFGVVEFDQDSWWKANGWTWTDIINAVSDHRPIWFRMDYMAADVDPD
jgi:endonuclease/exonuclease/phosphatase family metal-dependent hydrolase